MLGKLLALRKQPGIENYSNAFSHDNYLIVNQTIIPVYERIGKYLVKYPARGIAVFSQ